MLLAIDIGNTGISLGLFSGETLGPRWRLASVSERTVDEYGILLVQLLERLDHYIRRPGAGSVESLLRGIELVQDHQGLAAFFLEGHRGDGPTVTTFVISPDEARVRCHIDVPAEERHRL